VPYFVPYNVKQNSMIRTTAVVLLAVSTFALFSSAQSPAEPGKANFLRICSGCHETDIVAGMKLSREQWEAIVGQMIDIGAPATDAQMTQIVDYLAATFGPSPVKPKVNVNTASVKELVAGLGLSTAEGDAIVAHRIAKGNFAGVDDLKKVQGVDAAKIEAVKEQIAF
jgi:competence protein ComEA